MPRGRPRKKPIEEQEPKAEEKTEEPEITSMEDSNIDEDEDEE